ncbi:efflux RND transporter periplasmic adaptor subunit [Oceanicoccus sp. KOV_DT_Chl]|uniref:efflux RND transporter periplasmic adaptor subunit n=1 Tax=Oceanicoccus sp. KOV_DT_Chl TaxID=1904639 RepID=UPI00135A0197|nr:efflux RND transporter periplasmic adaptor subunit [Oceanicoccus sp. KOV_DT_Chl]
MRPTFPLLLTRLGLFTLILLVLPACEYGVSSPEPYYHKVSALTVVSRSDYQVLRHFVGHAEAGQRATLGFEVAGTIEKVLVDEGDSVVAGQVLARLDSRLLETQLRVIAAEAEDLVASKKLAQLDLQRQFELNTKGLAAQQRIDQLQSELSSLDARLKRQQALLESTQTQLEKQTLLAPYSGEISRRLGDIGTAVSPGMGILQLLERGNNEVRVGVPADLLAALTVGDKVTALIKGEPVEATVLALVRNVDTVTNTATLRALLPNGSAVADGEVVYVALSEVLKQQGFWLPETALSGGVRGMWNVYALVPADDSLFRIEARSIDVLYMDQGKAFVSGAVKDGEQVVATGLHRVAPDLLVRIEPFTDVLMDSVAVSTNENAKVLEP